MERIDTLSSGLNNLGNTCFFNSILQLLYQCTVLNKLLLLNSFEGKLIDIYINFLKSYTKSTKSFSPNMIVKYVSTSLDRNNYQQEDAEQYLNFILNNLIDEIRLWIKQNDMNNLIIMNKNISLDNLLDNMFTLKIKKTLICPKCNYHSQSNDDVNILYLSIGANNRRENEYKPDLNELLTQYITEILDNNNRWKCNNCQKKVRGIIHRELIKLPKYLIIVLKRYSNNNMKIDTKIYMDPIFVFKDKMYYLRGIVQHSGSTKGGHYTYYGNKGNVSYDNWNLYNDSRVSSVTEDILDNIINTGYVYLYVRK
jgi:ubiquitin C-terminal hydrolase